MDDRPVSELRNLKPAYQGIPEALGSIFPQVENRNHLLSNASRDSVQ
jgi:hypothetical protein